MKSYLKGSFNNDFLSSVVVFLVALPLCMGIAIASGVPPILGLISGIIGGLVVGAFSGAPLQVSGPAAGLAVMVFEVVDNYGIASLAPLGIITGAVQLVIFRFKLAEYFRAISPALIKGLLSGIGLLILASQLHVALDSKPIGGGLDNLLQIPSSFNSLVIQEGGGRVAFAVALTTLVSILLWQTFAKRLSKVIPAPLFAIIAVAGGNFIFETQVKFINIPSDFMSQLNIIDSSSFSVISFGFIGAAFAMAFIASAETLLSVSAVDKMSGKGTSNYNKEIMAQGLGNIVAGIFGALPLSGVIVRSSANISSGAETRGSAVMHGIWLFAMTFFFTDVLKLVPMSALAGILIYTGWKLMDIRSIPALWRKNRAEAMIYFTTFGLIVAVDLLTGVVVGFATSLCVLVIKLHSIEAHKEETEDEVKINLTGVGSFLHVPKISNILPEEQSNKKITVDTSSMDYLDWAVEEQLVAWKQVKQKQGINAEVVFKNLH
jgi:MFS superfamily sulfate permease-like transporter